MAIAADYESRILGFERDGLLELWRAIERRDTPDWEQGKALEYLILRAFQLEGAVVRWPYTAQLFGEDVEQIDGVIYWQDLKCLVEVKDTERPIALAPVAKLRNQLQRPAGGDSRASLQPRWIYASSQRSCPVLFPSGNPPVERRRNRILTAQRFALSEPHHEVS